MTDKKIEGTSNRILEVDLGKKEVEIHILEEQERKLYLGAKGLGLKLLYERLSPDIDPLSPENIIIFMPGVMMGTPFPCSNRFHAISKSPLTGIITTSSCGGPFGLHLKTAGWDGLILKGKSNSPLILKIDHQGVEFLDGSNFWGMGTSEFQKHYKIQGGELVIGPAGENLVPIANIRSGDRFLGRGGLGAVLGSKKIKAIEAIGGMYQILPLKKGLFEKTRKKAIKYINSNEVTSYLYRRYGTASNIILNNNANILPVRNFQKGGDDRAYHICGEEFKNMHLTTPSSCAKCAIRCGHKGKFKDKVLQVPEYETIALMSSNLGIFNRELLARWNNLIGEMGMDTISLGNILGWYMEAGERGILSSSLSFGDPSGIEEIIHDIAHCRGFGREAGKGVRYLSERYGGSEFAHHIKGLEVPGYDPRGSYGQALSYAMANRGACHLSAFMIAMDIYFRLLSPKTAWSKARYVKFFESLTACINSLQVCQFTMFAYVLESPISRYTPDIILHLFMENFPSLAIPFIDFGIYRDMWSAVTGIEISRKQFLEAGDRIVVLERYMNCREGISAKDDILPLRFLVSEVPLEAMKKEYYLLRGYNEEGIPTPSLLKKLKIS